MDDIQSAQLFRPIQGYTTSVQQLIIYNRSRTEYITVWNTTKHRFHIWRSSSYCGCRANSITEIQLPYNFPEVKTRTRQIICLGVRQYHSIHTRTSSAGQPRVCHLIAVPDNHAFCSAHSHHALEIAHSDLIVHFPISSIPSVALSHYLVSKIRKSVLRTGNSKGTAHTIVDGPDTSSALA